MYSGRKGGVENHNIIYASQAEQRRREWEVKSSEMGLFPAKTISLFSVCMFLKAGVKTHIHSPYCKFLFHQQRLFSSWMLYVSCNPLHSESSPGLRAAYINFLNVNEPTNPFLLIKGSWSDWTEPRRKKTWQRFIASRRKLMLLLWLLHSVQLLLLLVLTLYVYHVPGKIPLQWFIKRSSEEKLQERAFIKTE